MYKDKGFIHVSIRMDFPGNFGKTPFSLKIMLCNLGLCNSSLPQSRRASIAEIIAETNIFPAVVTPKTENTTSEPLYFLDKAALLSLICILIAVSTHLVASVRRLRHIPGPWWAAWSRLWLVRALASGDAAGKYEEVNQKYGMFLS